MTRMRPWNEQDGITISWRLGEVTTQWKTIQGKKDMSETWLGIAAATGLSEEHFIKQLPLLEEHIDTHFFDGDGRSINRKNRQGELHITFSIEISENQKG